MRPAAHSPMPRLPAARPLLAAALAAALLGACAKSSEVERLSETNRVQNQRLRALEEDVGDQLQQQQETLAALRQELRSLQGRITVINERSERLASEQQALAEGQERTQAEQRKLARLVEEERARMEQLKLEAQNDLDKMRLQLGQLEQALRSPIAGLPAKTRADKAFREAYSLLINGELDLAADEFAAFAEAHPKDERVVEALYQQGQALFLLRKYDHALIPFFEVVDKAPGHELAVPARWMLARSLEETGDLKLAREFYAQLINQNTAYANDATRRVAFINKLYPSSRNDNGGKGGG